MIEYFVLEEKAIHSFVFPPNNQDAGLPYSSQLPKNLKKRLSAFALTKMTLLPPWTWKRFLVLNATMTT